MQFQDILITGGAGFVGSNLAVMLREAWPDVRVIALDNLKRRGSELSLERIRRAGVRFVHGDIRCSEDLDAVGDFDLLIDCSAEPSAAAGLDGSPTYVLETNLAGTLNCLERARLGGAAFLFLSTSRVYPVTALNALPFAEEETRYRWSGDIDSGGFSGSGIAESFPLDGARSLYGASKLAAELVLGEYVYSYGLKALINRCGVIAGPGQLSRADQGVVTLWLARHFYGVPLSYVGFGGAGKQVRDILHVRDLFDLVARQLRAASKWSGEVYNIGGGLDHSASLLELTAQCEALTGNRLEIGSETETSEVDVRILIMNNARVQRAYDWRPRLGVERVLADTHRWIEANADRLKPVLA